MLSDDGLDLIFRNARTHKVWLDQPVPEELLRRVYDLARLGPTSANCSPMRVLFLTSREARERLRPALNPGHVDKTMQAPVTAIIPVPDMAGAYRNPAWPGPGPAPPRGGPPPRPPPRPRSATAASRGPT